MSAPPAPTPPPSPSVQSDTSVLLNFIEEKKGEITDQTYKTTLEALGRLRAPRRMPCPRHQPYPFFIRNLPRRNLPFKLEKVTLYTTSPLDYPRADVEILQNLEDDESSGLQILFYSTEKIE